MDTPTAQSLLNFAEGAVSELRGLESSAMFKQLDRRYSDLLAERAPLLMSIAPARLSP